MNPNTQGGETAGRVPQCPKDGWELLHDPQWNKGTAFSEEERDALGLRGLLPPHIATLDQQEQRVLVNFRRKSNDLERYVHLISLQDRNETLFYHVVMKHVEEMMPIIYTPTVGQACQQFGMVFRQTRGLYITTEDRGRVASLLGNWPQNDVRVIVITDGERILGLGDLGAFGMGIPIGKLSLYTACAGVTPAQCMPVMLDTGTDNPALLDDPLYTGLPQKRVRGAEYDDLVEEFVTAVIDRWPKALIQFEDFANQNAFRLLHKYRDRVCTFNDDIQGTAAVTLAGLCSARGLTGRALCDHTVLFLGAGEAGVGIGELIVAAMIAEGMPPDEAVRRCWFVDSKGLVVKGRGDLAEHKLPFAHDHPGCPDLLSAIRELKPTALIGVSTVAKAFDRAVVEAMSALNERPVIFALSNPTSKAECSAEDAYVWSGGRAVYASGSPFPPVVYQGRTYVPGQGNNAYIFPGVGLGVIACEARHVTDRMFAEAAKALAGQVWESDLEMGRVYPSLERIQEVSVVIAVAVAECSFREGLAGIARPDDLEALIRSVMWVPQYRSYV